MHVHVSLNSPISKKHSPTTTCNRSTVADYWVLVWKLLGAMTIPQPANTCTCNCSGCHLSNWCKRNECKREREEWLLGSHMRILLWRFTTFGPTKISYLKSCFSLFTVMTRSGSISSYMYMYIGPGQCLYIHTHVHTRMQALHLQAVLAEERESWNKCTATLADLDKLCLWQWA